MKELEGLGAKKKQKEGLGAKKKQVGDADDFLDGPRRPARAAPCGP